MGRAILASSSWASDVHDFITGEPVRHFQASSYYAEIAKLLGLSTRTRPRSRWEGAREMADGFAPTLSGGRDIPTRAGPVQLVLLPSSRGGGTAPWWRGSATRSSVHRLKVRCPICGVYVGLGTRALQHAAACPPCKHDECRVSAKFAKACADERRRRGRAT